MFLLATNKIKSRLLALMSIYFVIIETNRHRILNLHYFIWLKKALHLAMLYFQI